MQALSSGQQGSGTWLSRLPAVSAGMSQLSSGFATLTNRTAQVPASPLKTYKIFTSSHLEMFHWGALCSHRPRMQQWRKVRRGRGGLQAFLATSLGPCPMHSARLSPLPLRHAIMHPCTIRTWPKGMHVVGSVRVLHHFNAPHPLRSFFTG